MAATPIERDVPAELLRAGWEHDGDNRWAPWRLPTVSRWVPEEMARAIMDGEKCPAFLCHGPGHQSIAECLLAGEHDEHKAVYWPDGGHQTMARWRTGNYTSSLREKGIAFDPNSYPEPIGMTGFHNEPPEID